MGLQISKIVIKTDTFIGQLIHKVEAEQLDFVKKGQCMAGIIMGAYENLFQSVILLFSNPSENKIERVLKWQWKGKNV